MKNKNLIVLQTALKNYFTYFKTKDVLAVCDDNSSLPFAYLIFNKKNKPNLLLSLAIDYANSMSVANLVLIISPFHNVLIGEPFYFSQVDHKIYFNDSAYVQRNLELLPLDKMVPISNGLH